MRQVIILRGLPGSGKSTWAAKQKDARVVSADNFHISPADGVYRFEPKNAGKAHRQCFGEFCSWIDERPQNQPETTIIVDNTNTTAMEIAPYARYAELRGVPFKILHFMGSLERAYTYNTHGVPASTLLTMQRNLLEPLPAYWPQELKP